MINYIDTATMYFTFPVPSSTFYQTNNSFRMPKPWRYLNTAKDTRLHHWFLLTEKVFMAFYPDLYNHVRLFVTFSVPRFLKGNNLWHVTDFNEDVFYSLMEKELSAFPWDMPPFDSVNPPTSFKEWQASRIDLFLMHEIPVGQREEYMGAYELLMLSRYRPKKYKNTYYLNSSRRKDKKSNKVFRVYPKAQEVHDRLTGADYPLAAHKRHEAYLQMDETLHDFIRFEWMLRRNIIKYECNKINASTTMHDMFDQIFQEAVLSKLVSAAGLDLRILSRRDFKNAVKPLFKTDKTYQNALEYARLIRNNKTVTLTESQISRIKRTLGKNGIHYITTAYTSLKPVAVNP